ncbi:MAG: enoyl-CoA hydratase/isomerase family protein, partial [Dehalococcoidia bacterium]
MPVILYEVKERVAYITLNRPEVLNAINSELCECWNETWRRFRDDDQAWAAILTGAGDRAFSTGANLKEADSSYQEDGGQRRLSSRTDPLRPTQEIGVWKPIIGAINGYCLGVGMVFA